MADEASTCRGDLRKFVDTYLDTHPCTDCGRCRDHKLMKFVHTRGKRESGRRSPYRLAHDRASRDTILREIRNCYDVVCIFCLAGWNQSHGALRHVLASGGRRTRIGVIARLRVDE